MKKIYLYTMFAAAFLASCSDFEPDHSALSNKEISFKVKTNGIKQVGAESRVTPITDDNITNFGVMAFRRASTASIANMAPNFIYDAEVVKTGNRWATVEKQFWPKNSDVLDFYAYAPYHAEGITLSSASATGVPTITYDASSQLDLITATATNQALTVAGTGVPLTFNHALTTIKFEKSDELPGTITSISIKKVYNSGKLTIGGSWSFAGITRSDVAATEGVAMTMIPQQFSDSEQLIEVVYSYQGSNYTLQHQLSGSRWTAGTTLTYEITSTSLLTIKYDNDVVVTPWDNANEVATAMMKNLENTVNVGDYLFSDGSCGSYTPGTATAARHPIAVVFSNYTSPTDQAAGYSRGYAVALASCGAQLSWAAEGTIGLSAQVHPTLTNSLELAKANLDGRTETNRIKTLSDFSKENYPSAYYATHFGTSEIGLTSGTGSSSTEASGGSAGYAAPANTSGWYLGSIGQYYLVAKNLGGNIDNPSSTWQEGGSKYWYVSGVSQANKNALEAIFSKGSSSWAPSFGMPWSSGQYDTWYWTSSEFSASNGFLVNWYNNGDFHLVGGHAKSFTNTDTRGVRPVLAF